MPSEGFTKSDFFSPEVDEAVLLHLADALARRIVGRLDLLWECSKTGAIAVGWDGHADCFVRAIGVVEVAPLVEALLAVFKVAEASTTYDFGLERAMEPLIFALSLRMIGAAMGNPNAELHKPYGQGRPRRTRSVSPWSAVIHDHGFRQAITSEDFAQSILDRLPRLIGTTRTAASIEDAVRLGLSCGQRDLSADQIWLARVR